MKIEHLCDHRQVIPKLASWYSSEWEPYYGQDGPGDAHADLEARCNELVLPVGLVAITDAVVVGTATIGHDVTTKLTPSVIGLLVGKEYRRQGVATALIQSCEKEARRLGHQRLYISTNLLAGFLQHSGWIEIRTVEFMNNEDGSVYQRNL